MQSNAMQRVSVIRKLSKNNPQNSLIVIYNSFVRSYLDYGDVLYYQSNNESLCQKMERVQFNVVLAIICVIKGVSQTKLL